MTTAASVALGVVVCVLLAAVLGWLGLQVKPKPFPANPERSPEPATVPLPEDLPAPVDRLFRAIIGDEVPVIESAVITGRAQLRFMGITFPGRYRIVHDAGQGYRHYIEATLFGIPLMKVNESYLDGRARMELPVGVIENEEKVDLAANLGLWGESIWLPSVFLTDPRVRWEAIDDSTARLIVPSAAGEDSFTVYFDAESGLIEHMEAMRWKDPADTEKTLWRLDPYGWEEFHGLLIPSPAAVTWADEGTPWLVVDLQEVVYNADVREYIRAKGA